MTSEQQAGRDSVFEQLFRDYRQPILNYIYRLVGDGALAEDLAQQAFVKAYRALPDLPAEANRRAQVHSLQSRLGEEVPVRSLPGYAWFRWSGSTALGYAVSHAFGHTWLRWSGSAAFGHAGSARRSRAPVEGSCCTGDRPTIAGWCLPAPAMYDKEEAQGPPLCLPPELLHTPRMVHRPGCVRVP